MLTVARIISSLILKYLWNDTEKGNRNTRRKTCLSAMSSTTNPIWTDLGVNPGLRGDWPRTIRLSHGTTKPSMSLETTKAFPVLLPRYVLRQVMSQRIDLFRSGKFA